MNFRHPVFVAAARAVHTLFFLGSAAYCVLNYNSFAYYQFIRPELVNWLPDFVALHSIVYLPVVLIASLTLAPHLSGRRWIALSYMAPAVGFGLWLLTN